MITQSNGVESSDTQILMIQNFSSMPKFNLEMVKYQSTDDILGLSLTGKRKESDYSTRYILHDTIKKTEKNSASNLFDEHETLLHYKRTFEGCQNECDQDN
jgi:hypothetical protein